MQQWIDLYNQRGALWIHDGNAARPHVILTGEDHSNGYFNSQFIVQDITALSMSCKELSKHYLTRTSFDVDQITWIIGPAMGAINITTMLAFYLQQYRTVPTPIKCGYVEKVGSGKDKKFAIPDRINIQPKDVILQVEDVVTTGGSTLGASQALFERGAAVIPALLTLVNRSGLSDLNGSPIISLIDYEMPKWSPEICPLCKSGSKPVKAKGVEAWASLNAEYPTT